MKIFYILSVVLLAKQSLAETESTSTSNELTPNGKAFRAAVITKLVTLSEEPIKLGKKLFEDAYADRSNPENITHAIAEILHEFEWAHTTAARINLFLGLGLLCDVITNHTHVIDYGRRGEEYFFALKEALQKQDVMTAANEFHRKFDEFLEWLTQEYEVKRDKLTLEEQLRVTTFKELWIQFKDETNFEKRKVSHRAITKSVKG